MKEETESATELSKAVSLVPAGGILQREDGFLAEGA